ncbi:MAG: S-layer homology domain-containing protein [Thermoanaerobaculia bacterium]
MPTSHPLFRYVEALRASGITAGRNAMPPLYCPDSPLTRGQMAVFLANALGLRWAY